MLLPKVRIYEMFSSWFGLFGRGAELNPLNDLAKELKSVLKSEIRGVFVASMPDWHGVMEESAQYMRGAIGKLGRIFQV